jgi:hypothetical protein
MCMIGICAILHNFLLNQSDWVPDTWDDLAESWRMNLMNWMIVLHGWAILGNKVNLSAGLSTILMTYSIVGERVSGSISLIFLIFE